LQIEHRRREAVAVGHRYYRSSSFAISRFVLFSSRSSVGGGPYVVEESYPLAATERRLKWAQSS